MNRLPVVLVAGCMSGPAVPPPEAPAQIRTRLELTRKCEETAQELRRVIAPERDECNLDQIAIDLDMLDLGCHEDGVSIQDFSQLNATVENNVSDCLEGRHHSENPPHHDFRCAVAVRKVKARLYAEGIVGCAIVDTDRLLSEGAKSLEGLLRVMAQACADVPGINGGAKDKGAGPWGIAAAKVRGQAYDVIEQCTTGSRVHRPQVR